MKRSFAILLVWFIILGVLDLIVCTNREAKREKVYMISSNYLSDGNQQEYEIKGKYLRFEKNCSNFNYKLIDAFDDTLHPIEIYVEKNSKEIEYILFEKLEYSHYWLLFKPNEELTYSSDILDIYESKTLDNNKFLESFNSKQEELSIAEGFDKSRPLIISLTANKSNCASTYYEFYYNNQNELLVNYFIDDYFSDVLPNNTFKVDKLVIEELQDLMYQLDEENASFTTHSAIFLHNTIQAYSYNEYDFNLDVKLWETIKEYQIE